MAERALDLDLRLRVRQHTEQAQQHQANIYRIGKQASDTTAGRYVPKPPSGSQSVVVKGWISKASTTADHLRYLQHGKGRDGADATLFGPHGSHPKQFSMAAQADPHQFRFSVSLAQSSDFFPLRPYIEALMAKVEKDLGRPLDWVAASHYDTAHPHTHVVLRGKDRDGNDLYISDPYLKHGLRNRASWVATWLIGKDRSHELSTSMNTALERERSPERIVQKGLDHPLEQRRGQEMGL